MCKPLPKGNNGKAKRNWLPSLGRMSLMPMLPSGRIEWREDPFTWGVFNYRDKGDLVKETRVLRRKEWSRGQEYEAEGQDDEEF